MTTHSAIRAFFLDGPAGRLEALLNVGATSPTHCAVVAHPHPLYGGTMHNKVVFHAMKALNSFGFPVLRFNFRGAGSSSGHHDNARGEIDDVRAALDWLHNEFDLPIVFAGFSFGAAVGLRAACTDDRVAALIGLGLPISAEGREYSYDFLRGCSKPKLLISGDHDQYAPAPMLASAIAAVSEPKLFVVVHDADHFFAGHLDEMRQAVSRWVTETLVP